MTHRVDLHAPPTVAAMVATPLALLLAAALVAGMTPTNALAQGALAKPADAADATGGDVPVAGTTTPRGAATRRKLRFGVDSARIEAQHWPSAPEANVGATVRAQPFVLWQPDRQWEVRLGARLEADWQRGGPARIDQGLVSWADSFVRFRHEDTRISVGAQTIVWGRVDGVPLIDRVSRVDLRRFGLDELSERRLPHWAVRWEQSFGDMRLDAVWLPSFRASQLPEDGSVWHPISRPRAQIIGIDALPMLAPFFRAAAVDVVQDGSGGVALRLTRTGEPLDLGFTLAHTRQPLPYFELDSSRTRLAMVHPYNRFVAVDAEFVSGNATWRTELAYTLDLRLTRPDGSAAHTNSVDWVGGVEFFPGGKDTRINLQLMVHAARASETVLELKRYVGLNGEVETALGAGQWKAALRFSAGLNVHDNYIAPKLSYTGWEPHELYATAHLFGGEPRTLSGFHRRHDTLVVGLKTRF